MIQISTEAARALHEATRHEIDDDFISTDTSYVSTNITPQVEELILEFSLAQESLSDTIIRLSKIAKLIREINHAPKSTTP